MQPEDESTFEAHLEGMDCGIRPCAFCTDPSLSNHPQGLMSMAYEDFPEAIPGVVMEVIFEHNMEVAHRLFLQPGKCQNIHGHSMFVTLMLSGQKDANGIFEGLDFSSIKKRFRKFIDDTYDHHLLLNKDDPWARTLCAYADIDFVDDSIDKPGVAQLPGLVTCPGDPTTENLATWICRWAMEEFKLPCAIKIEETRTNSVMVDSSCLVEDFD